MGIADNVAIFCDMLPPRVKLAVTSNLHREETTHHTDAILTLDNELDWNYGLCTKEMIMQTLPKQLSECTVFLLAKAYQRAHGGFKKLLKPYGLTNIQHIVLETLYQEPGGTAVELGKLLTLDKATLSGVIDRLCESGWLVKQVDEVDNRVQRLYLKDKTLEVITELSEKRDKFDASLLADFSLEERVLLKRLLKELI